MPARDPRAAVPGSAFEVLATPYGIVILLPVAFGLAALVCLERFPGKGDLLACLLLIAAVASQSVGLAFVAGATVVLVQQSGRAAVARLWVVLAPGALYVAWFAWSRLSGPEVPDPVQLDNLTEVPLSVVKLCAAGLAAISGLFGGSGFEGGVLFEHVQPKEFHLAAGYLLLVLLIIAAVWRVRSGSGLAKEVWVAIALALTFWVLVAMVAGGARGPRVSRYLYPSAVFLLLIVLELVRGVRPRPRLIWLGAGALLVSLVPNLVNLNDEARQIRDFATLERSQLGALELLRDEVPAASIPALRLDRGVLDRGPPGAHRRLDVLRSRRSLREPRLQPGGDRRRGREPARGRSTRCSSRDTISPSPSFPPAVQPAGNCQPGVRPLGRLRSPVQRSSLRPGDPA